MAEINENFSQNNFKKISKKIQVDLTPMVDLGFLLITFFIFTSVISQPSVARLQLPKDTKTDSTPIEAKAALTVTLTRNDSISYFDGIADTATHKFCSYQSIRSVIQQKQKLVQHELGNSDETVLIIKPTVDCSYKNFINVMDEVFINDVKHYYVTAYNK